MLEGFANVTKSTLFCIKIKRLVYYFIIVSAKYCNHSRDCIQLRCAQKPGNSSRSEPYLQTRCSLTMPRNSKHHQRRFNFLLRFRAQTHRDMEESASAADAEQKRTMGVKRGRRNDVEEEYWWQRSTSLALLLRRGRVEDDQEENFTMHSFQAIPEDGWSPCIDYLRAELPSAASFLA